VLLVAFMYCTWREEELRNDVNDPRSGSRSRLISCNASPLTAACLHAAILVYLGQVQANDAEFYDGASYEDMSSHELQNFLFLLSAALLVELLCWNLGKRSS